MTIPQIVKQKLNKLRSDKGVTILEIVIAVAILAAVSIPVARAIVASSKYNYQAKVREKLTIVSESLMEDFKAYTIKEMQEKYSESEYSDWLLGCEVDENTSFKVENLENNVIKFTASQIKVGNIPFDMTATVTPVSGYSNQTLTMIKDFDKETCAFAEIYDNQETANSAIRNNFKSNYAQLFINELLTHEKIFVGEQALTVDDIDYSYLKLLGRTITVYITKGAANYNLYYEISYKYDMKEYPYNEDEKGNTGYFDYGEFEFTDKTGQTFYTNAITSDLQRLFMYYYPVYVNRNGDGVTDTITLINSTGEDLDFYLLKQTDPDLGVAVNTYEQSYCPYVSGDGKINIYHNLAKNLGTGAGNDYYTGRVSGFSNGCGESIEDAVKTENNTLLYTVDIEITRNEEVCTKLSSTIKK